MRVFLALILIGAAAWGGAVERAAPPPTDLQTLWEFPYEFDLLEASLLCNGGNHTQDYFTFEESGVIRGFDGWFIYDGNHPQPFEAIIFFDYDGRPGGRKWMADIADVTDIDTGDDTGDFDVYRTELRLDEEDYVFIEAGETYWLELFWTGFIDCGWLCSLGGNAHSNGDEYNLSTFFRILGVPSGEGVEPMSWGEIKATF
jgi:hypothetical protein